ncbi:MAG: dihydrofolate reductase family protein [Fibrobacter sp.]|nr:dihydrofolate reductase family protein [Fibrobacter sp.]
MNFLQTALELSFGSVGISRPNPAVGAVVVKDGIVVGRGRTQRPCNAHAEVMALRDAGELARGAAIYVTLEPCCHYGRTPPCTKAIIDAGISEVYFAHADPNPVVRGKSRKILEDAGITVYEGEDACVRACFCDGTDNDLHASSDASCECGVFGYETAVGKFVSNVGAEAALVEFKAEGRSVFHEVERYFEAYDYFVRNKRTFVEIKSAVSEDGFMGCVTAKGRHAPLKITGQGANCWNHELRAMSDAVLVGAGTLLADNPRLDVRYAQGNNPVKVIWAGHHKFTKSEIALLHVFALHQIGTEGVLLQPLVFSCVPQPAFENPAVTAPTGDYGHGVELVLLPHESFADNWNFMIENLSARGMHRLMVEPGAALVHEIFNAPREPEKPLWNRIDLWRSTDPSVDASLERLVKFGKAKAGLKFPGLPDGVVAKESAMIGPDVLTVYYGGER